MDLQDTVPSMNSADELPVQEMLKYFIDTYKASYQTLARMYQTNKSTIHYWITTGKISYRNLAKVRKSYFFFQNAADPHKGQRQCTRCGEWKSLESFRVGKTYCKRCEYRRARRA